MVIPRDRFSNLPLHELMDSFSCSPLFYFIKNKLPEVPEYTKMSFHMMASL